MSVFLGIDWGGTYIKTGIVDHKGKILKRLVYSSRELKKKKVFIGKIKSLVDNFSKFNIKGVGIGAPGIIDTKKGSIYYLPNIVGWRNYPLRKVLRKKLKLPVFVDNDANLFALAEGRLGRGRGMRRAIILTLGTGLGGAVILNGKILQGETSAWELGHVPISLKGRLCRCGGRGCIETFVGARYLLERYREISRVKVREVKDIFDRALNGQRQALIVLREFSYNLGKFLAGMVNVFNPEVIILGGGLSGAFKLFKPFVWEAIKKQVMWPQIKGLKLVRARLKEPGIIGAALLVRGYK